MPNDSWLQSVPYGGYGKVGQGAYPSQYDEQTTSLILIAGLTLITGGGAAVGYFISGTRLGALVGALVGLGYSSANLAINTAALAAQMPPPKTQDPNLAPPPLPQMPAGLPQGQAQPQPYPGQAQGAYPQGGGA